MFNDPSTGTIWYEITGHCGVRINLDNFGFVISMEDWSGLIFWNLENAVWKLLHF